MKKVLLLCGALLIAAPVYAAGSLTLNWTDNSNNEDGFKIERKQGPTGMFAEIAQVGVDVVTFSDVTPDLQEYCYRVRAFNAVGDSTYSNEDCGIPTLAPVVPSNPTGLVVTSP